MRAWEEGKNQRRRHRYADGGRESGNDSRERDTVMVKDGGAGLVGYQAG